LASWGVHFRTSFGRSRSSHPCDVAR
jgi:hypothetical protein